MFVCFFVGVVIGVVFVVGVVSWFGLLFLLFDISR